MIFTKYEYYEYTNKESTFRTFVVFVLRKIKVYEKKVLCIHNIG